MSVLINVAAVQGMRLDLLRGALQMHTCTHSAGVCRGCSWRAGAQGQQGHASQDLLWLQQRLVCHGVLQPDRLCVRLHQRQAGSSSLRQVALSTIHVLAACAASHTLPVICCAAASDNIWSCSVQLPAKAVNVVHEAISSPRRCMVTQRAQCPAPLKTTSVLWRSSSPTCPPAFDASSQTLLRCVPCNALAQGMRHQLWLHSDVRSMHCPLNSTATACFNPAVQCDH